ncbi:MAG: hypothetical protein D4R56_04160 [Deltaproteobacteria bacterium]|nr:MAG: hypothetical protein D4R56_04160 [Deltaproteobacteria bacterium]
MDLIDILFFDKVLFFEMVKKCNETYRSGHDLSSYLEIIGAHRSVGNISQLIEDDDFIRTIYETLKLWNMNQQGAVLESYQTIKESILNCQEYLNELYGVQLNVSSSKELANLKDTLFLLFRDLKTMKSKRRIVGVSKTMHFLLPDLIMPVDGKYTMNALFGYNKLSKTATAEFDDMFYILRRFHDMACKFELSSNDCSQTGWNTSVPKLIDNAIIGITNNLDYAIDYLKSMTIKAGNSGL